MKTNILKLTAIFLILATGLTSCEDNEKPFTLKDTKWKLVNIVDTETGNLEVLVLKDCEECYTLTFVTNTIAEGLVEIGSFREEFILDLSRLGERICILTHSRPNGVWLFLTLLYNQNTKSYSVTPNELKFINENANYYLLFKPL
jgi:hypothetical protein